MQFNLLLLSALLITLLNIVWIDQIRIRRRLKKRVLKRPLFAIYLVLSPVLIVLCANLIPYSALLLLALTVLGLSFSFSHLRFGLTYYGASTNIIPLLSMIHMLAGFSLLTSTLVQII